MISCVKQSLHSVAWTSKTGLIGLVTGVKKLVCSGKDEWGSEKLIE